MIQGSRFASKRPFATLLADQGARKKAKPDPKGSELMQWIKDKDVLKVEKWLSEHPGMNLSLKSAFGGRKTPLHLAAKGGVPRLVRLLLESGADPQAVDHRGRLPVHLAMECNHPQTTGILLDAPHTDQPYERWHSKKSLERGLEELALKLSFCPPEAREAIRDEAVSQLTGVPLKSLNDHRELYKYLSHLSSWSSATLNTADEGWWDYRMLPQRIRSVVKALLETPEFLTKADGSPDGAKIAALYEELGGQLESLRFAFNINSIGHLEDPVVYQKALEAEASRLTSQLLSLSPQKELTLPLGFPGHAIYLGLRKLAKDEGLFLRIDNLGLGLESHKQNHSKVLPYTLAIKGPPEELAPLLEPFLAKVLDVHLRPQSSGEEFYGHLDRLHQELLGQGIKVNTESNHLKRKNYQQRYQVAGNCVLKNHSAGMMARLGKNLFKELKKFEKKGVIHHPNFPLKESYVQSKDMEKDASTFRELLQSRGDQAGIKGFFNKKDRTHLARSCGFEVLAKLVQEDHLDTLSLLVQKGASLEQENQNGDSLLHLALEHPNSHALEHLLKLGHDPNPTNHQSLTPLHLSIQKGKPESVRVLLAFGADPLLKDQEGESALHMADRLQNAYGDISEALKDHRFPLYA